MASGAAAALLVLWIVSGSIGGASDAQLVALDPLMDFGLVPHGAVLKHEFTLQNNSDDTLRLALGPPSCGCTVGDLKTQILAPGASTVLEAPLETAGRIGEVRAAVPVRATSATKGGRYEFAVYVIAEVDPQIGLMPASIDFGEVRRRRSPTTRPVKLIIS
jgi:hypothetical protein